MTEYLYPYGAVYILENSQAQRVKVGMTGIGVNNVIDRLADVNDMWLERKVTCQICGKRTVHVRGNVPLHVVSGKSCPGGASLPLESDVAVATSYIEFLERQAVNLVGSDKASATKRLNTLKARVEKYRGHRPPVGEWQFSVVYYTEGVAEVERCAHTLLAAHLDGAATIGEVFCCSVAEATAAIEEALSQMGLLDSARKVTEVSAALR